MGHRQGYATRRNVTARNTVGAHRPARFRSRAGSFPFLPRRPTGNVLGLRFTTNIETVARLVFRPLRTGHITLPIERGTQRGGTKRATHDLHRRRVHVTLQRQRGPFVPRRPVETVFRTLYTNNITRSVKATLLFHRSRTGRRATFLPA